jgi:YVTN family beta-propeller protein
MSGSRPSLPALGLLVTLLLACGGGSQARPASAIIASGANPAGVVVTEGAAWVANAADGTVSRINLSDNRVMAVIRIGDPGVLRAAGCGTESIHAEPHGSFKIRRCDLPRAITTAPGAIWTSRGDTKELVRLDPRSNHITGSIQVGIDPWYIAASDTAVWATDYYTDTVVHVDPRTMRLVATITGLAYGPTGIAIAGDSVWVASSRADVVSRIDAASNRVVATIPVEHVPLPVVFAYGSIWVRNEMAEGNGFVTRINPLTNKIVTEVPVGPEAGRDGLDGMAVTDSGLWVAGLRLQRIDPRLNKVTAVNNHTANAVSYGAGSLWTIDIGFSITRLAVPA